MLRTGLLNGHPAVWLESPLLRVSVLPEKGADIYELVYKPGDIDFLLKTPGGLQPPGVKTPEGFLENYEGGWQVLFPNPNDGVAYRGISLPFHGEAALLPWTIYAESDDDQETSIHLQVHCRRTPFSLERRMRLLQDQPVLFVEDTVTNQGDVPAEFLLGQHVVLGGDFLEAGCQLDTPAGRIITPAELYEPDSACLAPGQSEPWPYGLGRLPGEASFSHRIDLRQVPGPQAHIHDDVFLSELGTGQVSVTNNRLGLRFQMDWDPAAYRCIVNWRPLGGADLPPLTGIYGLGIEPWMSRFNLLEAIEQGEAQRLEPGERWSTVLQVSIQMKGNLT